MILTFGGFMTTKTHLTVPGVILASTIGSVAGAVVLYLIGLLLEVRRLERIVERWGHVLRVKKKTSIGRTGGLPNTDIGPSFSAG